MTDSPLKAVLFDIGGVILLPDGARLAKGLEPLAGRALDPTLVRDSLFRLTASQNREGVPLALSVGERADAWATLLELPREQAVAAWDKLTELDIAPMPLWSEPDPDAVHVLRWMREQGLQIAAVSNSTGRLRRELEHAKIERYFDAIVDSRHEGVAKPDPRIFHAAFEDLGLAGAEEAAYIGDTYFFDMIAALAAGIENPVLYDRLDLYDDAPDCVRVRRLEELIGIVEARRQVGGHSG